MSVYFSTYVPGCLLLIVFLFTCNCISVSVVTAATAAVEGKMSKGLKKVLKRVVVKEAHEELAVADAKLGSSIKVINHFSVSSSYNSSEQPDVDVCRTS